MAIKDGDEPVVKTIVELVESIQNIKDDIADAEQSFVKKVDKQIQNEIHAIDI